MAIAPPYAPSRPSLVFDAPGEEFNRVREVKSRVSQVFLPHRSDEFIHFVPEDSPNPEINVVGVGIGELVQGGHATGLLCVKIYVRKKYATSDIRKGWLLPTDYDSVPVDVEESGVIHFLSASDRVPQMPDPTEYSRPVSPGSSVSACGCSGKALTGTIGAIVTDETKVYVLSNDHILRPTCEHDDTYQPGSSDMPTRRYGPIGRYSNGIGASVGEINDIDAAVAELSERPEPETLYVGGPRDWRKAVRQMPVHIFGRTSRYVSGFVDDVDFDAKIPIGANGPNVFYTNQIKLRASRGRFSRFGDSGALVQDSERRSVGLLFAGSDYFSVANDLRTVEEKLGVKVVYSRSE